MSDSKVIRITSDTVDAAIRRAEATLKLPREELGIKIVQKDSKGLIGRKKAIVEFSFDPNEQELRAREYEIEKFIDLKIITKGIYLKVDPLPKELAARASHVIRKYLRRRNVLEVDRELLMKIVEKQCGKYILIQNTDVITIGTAHVSIYKTFDSMLATLIRYDLEPLDKDDLLAYLEKLNIRFGIKQDILQNLNDKRLMNRAVVIAQGLQPVTEIAAPVKYYFDPDMFTVRFDENDKVDFKNVSQLAAVKKSEILAEKTGTIKGTPGKRIDGTEAPFDVERDGPFPHGKGVSVSKDGRKLIADIDGHLVYDYGIIAVEPTYVVKGNVDYHTGNVEFDGGVIVGGDILPGFRVIATGKVEVYGVIDCGIVETDGSLVVKQGIFSKDRGHIKIGGTLIAKHIEGMKIHAEAVRVHSNIVNADVKAVSYVEVYGDPGTIIGGTIEAGDYVKANTIGSPMGNKTHIAVGDPGELLQKSAETAGEIRARKEQAEEVGRIAGPLLEYPREAFGNPLADSDVGVAAVQEYSHLTRELEELDREMAQLREKQKRLKVAKVHFRDRIFEGVNIRVFTGNLAIREPVSRGSVVWENEEVKIIHYHYVEGI